eukprot:4606275-Amphidinium_carterae.1
MEKDARKRAREAVREATLERQKKAQQGSITVFITWVWVNDASSNPGCTVDKSVRSRKSSDESRMQQEFTTRWLCAVASKLSDS